ncbi:MAG: secondary thiamine-phosphate synthase enzyme YjbQ [Dehalogenimonas sp.]
MLGRFSFRTSAKIEFLDITGKIQRVVDNHHVENGACIIFVPHTTAGITVNENADPAVLRDLKREIQRLTPQRADFEHSEGNSPAHVAASLTGHSLTAFIEGGRLVLGTWQAIYLAEFDGPRQREVLVKILPEV